MKKFFVVFSAFMLLLGLSGAAGAAVVINFDTVVVGNEFTSPYATTRFRHRGFRWDLRRVRFRRCPVQIPGHGQEMGES